MYTSIYSWLRFSLCIVSLGMKRDLTHHIKSFDTRNDADDETIPSSPTSHITILYDNVSYFLSHTLYPKLFFVSAQPIHYPTTKVHLLLMLHQLTKQFCNIYYIRIYILMPFSLRLMRKRLF